MKRFAKIILLVLVSWVLLMPRAEAIDPITMGVLAPIAMRFANAAKPYIARGLRNGLLCGAKMVKDAFEITYLPFGILRAIFYTPFKGGLRRSCRYMIKGCIAPGKLILHALLLGPTLLGLNINI